MLLECTEKHGCTVRELKGGWILFFLFDVRIFLDLKTKYSRICPKLGKD